MKIGIVGIGAVGATPQQDGEIAAAAVVAFAALSVQELS